MANIAKEVVRLSGYDYPIRFNSARCKKCGFCSYYCPQGVIARNEQNYPYAAAPEKCVRCYLCYQRCPDFALEVNAGDRKTVFAG